MCVSLLVTLLYLRTAQRLLLFAECSRRLHYSAAQYAVLECKRGACSRGVVRSFGGKKARNAVKSGLVSCVRSVGARYGPVALGVRWRETGKAL